jgi:hypothetical protein
MANMKVIHEDFFTEVLEDYFEGIPVRFFRNKFSGEIKICGNDMARCLGFNSLNDMLSTDKGLDVISEWRKEHPNKPVFGSVGSGAMFEEANFNK